jgi:hypothetical protein
MKVDFKEFNIESLEDLKEALETIVSEITSKKENNSKESNPKENKRNKERSIAHYIKEMCDTIDLDTEDFPPLMGIVEPLLPTTGINMLLRHLAYKFNAERKESIDSLDKLYLIDLATNSVVERQNLKKYLTRVLITYAVFKRKEDAERALKIVQPAMFDLYGKL